MLTEGVIALLLFSLLVKFNYSVSKAKLAISEEISRNLQLTNTLDSFVALENATPKSQIEVPPIPSTRSKTDDLVKEVTNRPIIKVDSNRIKKGFSGPSTIPLDTVETKSISTVATSRYALDFKTPIKLSATNDIVSITGFFLLRINGNGQPEQVWSRLEVKEIDKSQPGKVTTLSTRVEKESITTDNMLTCILSENRKPELNEYGLPTYQRRLAIKISGSLKAKSLEGLITWEELSGRPAWAKISFPITGP